MRIFRKDRRRIFSQDWCCATTIPAVDFVRAGALFAAFYMTNEKAGTFWMPAWMLPGKAAI
jgi:hypothetical protein